MIRFESRGGIGRGTRLVDTATGEDLQQVIAVEYGVQITLGETVTAACKLSMVEADIEAGKTEFLTKHPVSKDFKPIAAIEFRDGWRTEFTEDGTPRVRKPNPTR